MKRVELVTLLTTGIDCQYRVILRQTLSKKILKMQVELYYNTAINIIISQLLLLELYTAMG